MAKMRQSWKAKHQGKPSNEKSNRPATARRFDSS